MIHKILPETTMKLPLQPVNGIKIPERTGVCSILWGEPVPFSHVYNLENAKEPAPLSIFTAKTEELEIKTVFQKIKDTKSQLDENVIYYTSGDQYITSIYHLSQKGDIPITFGEGIPVSFSRPGRLAGGILQWIKSNYSVTAFLDLLNQGILTLEGGAPSNILINWQIYCIHCECFVPSLSPDICMFLPIKMVSIIHGQIFLSLDWITESFLVDRVKTAQNV